MYDVIIIGGGVSGASIARELSAYKLSIALLEKEEELAFGVSKSNSGIIHPGTQNRPGTLKGRLCVQGNILMRETARELGIDFKEVGELILAFNKNDIDQLKKVKVDAETLGVPRLEIVGRNWLREHEPNLSKKVIAALYAPTAGVISPYRFVYALSENASRNGVRIFTNTRVKNIEFCGSKRHRCFRIYSEKTIFMARYVINAAGLYADDISRMTGVDNFSISPRKGEEFILDKKKEYLTNHLLFPLPSKNSKGILVIKTADGNPMIGPTAEETNNKEDLSTSDRGLKNVLDSVKKMLPTVNKNDIIAYFAGLRPAAGNDFIIRHEDSVPGFINVAGIQSPGLTAAPAIALLVRDILRKNGLEMKEKTVFHKYRPKISHLSTIPLSKTKQLIKKDKSYGDIVCRCEMVSAKEIKDSISRGARTLDGIKFRTRAQSGRCHGGFCTTRLMKILAGKSGIPVKKVTKRGKGSEIVLEDRTEIKN